MNLRVHVFHIVHCVRKRGKPCRGRIRLRIGPDKKHSAGRTPPLDELRNPAEGPSGDHRNSTSRAMSRSGERHAQDCFDRARIAVI